MLHRYQVALIHPETGTQLDLIGGNRIVSLSYNREINNFGSCQLTILGNDRASQYLNLTDMFIEIYRDNGSGFEVEDTFFMRFSEPLHAENGDKIIYGGQSLMALFDNRLIRFEDDPAGANGFSTKGGSSTPADTVIYSYVEDQCINPAVETRRTVPGLSNGANFLLGQPVFARKSYENLLETLQELAALGQVDFTLTRTSGINIEFNVTFIGTDRSKTTNYPALPFVYFSTRRGNVDNPRFSIDRNDEKTVVYVQAQGPEEDRIIYPVIGPEIFDSPYNWREMTEDAREIEDNASLLTGLNTVGFEALRSNALIQQFSFKVQPESPQSRYNEDWFLGDIVTAEYLGQERDFRITGVEIDISRDSENITPSFNRRDYQPIE